MSPSAQRVFEAVSSIPYGKCASYGLVGLSLDPPLSGLVVGRILSHTPDEVPWWRVVGRDGRLLVGKKDPRLEIIQAERIQSEGIKMEDGAVLSVFLLTDL